MNIEPYLFFEGRCEEAIEFYSRVLDAKLDMLMRYDESPEPPPADKVPPGCGRKVMHAALRIGETRVMASDGFCAGQPTFRGFSLSITAADEAAATRLFDGLAADGQVQMPLGRTFWSPCFGMVTDRFGVTWMVGIPD